MPKKSISGFRKLVTDPNVRGVAQAMRDRTLAEKDSSDELIELESVKIRSRRNSLENDETGQNNVAINRIFNGNQQASTVTSGLKFNGNQQAPTVTRNESIFNLTVTNGNQR